MPTINLETTSEYHSTAAEKSKMVEAGIIKLHRLFGPNLNASSTNSYLQVHDVATAPSNGAVPLISIISFANANFDIPQELLPASLVNGLFVCLSSSAATLTLIATNDAMFNVKYVVIPNYNTNRF